MEHRPLTQDSSHSTQASPAGPNAGRSRASSPRAHAVRHSLAHGVHREVLPNGATLLVKRSSGSPVVAITTHFKVGYFHEADHESGLAHLMEHLFFKGSQSYPGPEQVSEVIEALGGSLNAGTIYDRTFYYFVLPSHALVPAIKLMGDATVHPLLDETEMRKEIEVVIEESNRKRDNPQAMATESMYHLAYDVHRMRRWRIGSDDVLRSMTRDLAVAFHERLYRPAHLIISLVGDLDVEQARALALAAFAPLAPGAPLREDSPPEPPQTRMKVGYRSAPIQLAHLELGFKLPPRTHPDHEGLLLLAQILGQGRISRLHRALKSETGLVKSVSASAFAYDDLGMLHISMTLEPHHIEAARKRLWLELERTRHFGVTARELRVAREQHDAGRLFQLEEVRGQAVSLAWYEANGGIEQAELSRARLHAVKPSDLQRLAQEYLIPSQATLYYYVPESGTKIGHPGGIDAPPSHAATPIETRTDTLVTEWISTKLQVIAGGNAQRPHVPALQVPTGRRLPGARRARVLQEALPDGGELLVLESPELPIVSLGVYFAGGRGEERLEQTGITRLTLRTVRNGGTRDFAPDAFFNALNALGASLEPVLDVEQFGYKLHLPSARLTPGIKLLEQALVYPRMDPARLELERKSMLLELKAAHDQTARSATDLLMRATFGEDHPLGCPEEGREAVLQALTRDQLLDWHTEKTSRSHRMIVAAGDVRAESLRDAVLERLGGLSAERPALLQHPWEGLTGIHERAEPRQKRQTAIAMAFQGPPPTDPDAVALQALLVVLGGSSGRLKAELRGKQSLAYSVGAHELGRPQHNLILCTIACEASKEQAARDGILYELARVQQARVEQGGVTAEELAKAKALLIGRRATGLQSLSARVGQYAWAISRGLGVEGYERRPELVAQLTQADLLRVARRYFTLDRYAIGIARGRGK